MDISSFVQQLPRLKAIVREAGSIILKERDKWRSKKVGYSVKEDGSFVTEADKKSENLILEELGSMFPKVPVVSEESAIFPYTSIQETISSSDSRYFFLVDPLDGTEGFVKGLDEFVISIGLIYDCSPVFGIIYAPCQKRLFYAWKDEQQKFCFEENDDDQLSRPIHVVEHLSEIRVSGSRSEKVLDKYFYKYFVEDHRIKRFFYIGSAIKFGMLASGEIDVYIRNGPTMEWDTAAGHIIVECAGGCLMLLDGKPLLYGKFHQNLKNPPFFAYRASLLSYPPHQPSYTTCEKI